MRQANREDVVHAALLVERWCAGHCKGFAPCDCPLHMGMGQCVIEGGKCPAFWNLEEFLRTLGQEARDD